MEKAVIVKELSKKNLILVENQVVIDSVRKRFSIKKKKIVKGGLYPGQTETVIVAKNVSLDEIVEIYKLKIDKLPDEPPQDTEPEDPEEKLKERLAIIKEEEKKEEEKKTDIDEAKKEEKKSAKQPKD